MAVARIVCGRCGGVLPEAERFCPQCGERVEREISVGAGQKGAGIRVPCAVCGHTNVQPGAFCESCGSRLASTPSGEPGSPTPASKAQPSRRSFGVEPWQVIVAAALVVLLGFFMYQELMRDHGTGHAHSRASQNHDHDHGSRQVSAGLAEDIARLEGVVSKNPNDTGALLQLANRFHDASQAEPRYLMKAIDTYRQYLTLNPSDPNARVDLGICYFEVGRIDSSHASQFFGMAIREMKGALAEHPSHQSAAFNLGIVTLFAGNADESTGWFTKVVEINPESDLGKRAKRLLEQHSFSTQ